MVNIMDAINVKYCQSCWPYNGSDLPKEGPLLFFYIQECILVGCVPWHFEGGGLPGGVVLPRGVWCMPGGVYLGRGVASARGYLPRRGVWCLSMGVYRMTDACENITSPQLLLLTVNIGMKAKATWLPDDVSWRIQYNVHMEH